MKYPLAILWLFLAATCPAVLRAAETVWLSSLDIGNIEQDWGKPQADRSVGQHKLSVNGQIFEHGIGTHANSEMVVDLKKGASRFNAAVGVDDEVRGNPGASVEFHVVGDGKPVWDSGVMKAGDAAKLADIDVTGVGHLILLVDAAGDTIDFDHADWADARVEVTGEHPQTMAVPHVPAVILTPKTGPAPRLTGPAIFGVRPGAPLLFTVTAAGEQPMEFSADGLPSVLQLDAATGRITGTLPRAGEFAVTVHARNRQGAAERKLRLICGESIALTPPMGWNSWNCWAGAVDRQKVLEAAHALIATGLAQHGWSYVNIDDTWQGERDPQSKALQPDAKFPDMKGLCEEIHRLGLKAGIYSTPWVTSYAMHTGGSADNSDGTRPPGADASAKQWRLGKYSFAQQDARQWAAWGFDYLKYDWHPIDIPNASEMAGALKASGRDIVYSLSNRASFETAGAYAGFAQCWRTTGDIQDNWNSVSGIGFSQDRWTPFGGPGHWNDPDMLVAGYVGWGARLHSTHLTPDEQYTHISLWCLLSAPLLLGCDLDRLDDFTLGLLTNDEVLDIDQDSLGQPARCVRKDPATAVYAKELADGSRAVGLFNLARVAREVRVGWSDLGITGPRRVRDLWRQQDLGTFDAQYAVSVPAHGVVLVRLTPTK